MLCKCIPAMFFFFFFSAFNTQCISCLCLLIFVKNSGTII